MGRVLDNLECLLAILILGGCTASMSSIGIGPLVFIIIAIIRLVGSKFLGERAKLLNTVLTASILGAIAHIVSAFALASLYDQIPGTKVLHLVVEWLEFALPVLMSGLGWLMAASPVLISGLVVGAFAAYRSRCHVVPTALAAAVAAYIALGWEGLFYYYILPYYILPDNQHHTFFLGGITFLFLSVVQLWAAELGAILFSLICLLIERHRHE